MVLDGDKEFRKQVQAFSRIIEQSLLDRKEVVVMVESLTREKEYRGIITEINREFRKIRIEWDEDFEYIKLDDITYITNA